METSRWAESESLLRLVQAQQKVSRNLDGVIAPGVFIDIVKGGSLDEALKLTDEERDDCISQAFGFITHTGRHHKNPYHNSSHPREVYGRTQVMVVTEDLDARFAALHAAVMHDYDHPGKNPTCDVGLKFIVSLYADKYSGENIRAAYDMMIELDNALIAEENCLLPLEKRKPSRQSFDSENKITLTPEEVSGLHSDANLMDYGFQVGKLISLRVRALGQGLIKATDFNNKRNFPKTPLEWQFKMADMANFTKPTSSWLATAVKVGLEAPWGLPANIEKFVDGEIFFLEKMVREPILQNPETDGLFPSWIHLALQEKVKYLLNIKNEVERMKMGLRNREEASGDLINFLEAVKKLFPNDSVDTIPLF